jgi:hypothetical protein
METAFMELVCKVDIIAGPWLKIEIFQVLFKIIHIEFQQNLREN